MILLKGNCTPSFSPSLFLPPSFPLALPIFSNQIFSSILPGQLGHQNYCQLLLLLYMVQALFWGRGTHSNRVYTSMQATGHWLVPPPPSVYSQERGFLNLPFSLPEHHPSHFDFIHTFDNLDRVDLPIRFHLHFDFDLCLSWHIYPLTALGSPFYQFPTHLMSPVNFFLVVIVIFIYHFPAIILELFPCDTSCIIF